MARPVTSRVDDNVASFFTARVDERTVALFTVSVDDSVVATGDTTSLTFSNPVPDAQRLFFRVSEN